MNSMQFKNTPHSRLLPIVRQVERKRFSHISDQEWEQLLKNAREDLQGFIDFEEYIESRFRQGNVRDTSFVPSFELSYLTYNMFELAKALDLDLFKFIDDFNINLNYSIHDSKTELKPMIHTLLQVDLDHLSEDDLEKLDSPEFTLLPSNEVENIILRYYYFKSLPSTAVQSSLNIPTRKLLFTDFNDLLYIKLPIDTLIAVINKKYRTLAKSKLYKSLIDKVQRQDKYYLIDFDEINESEINNFQNPIPNYDLITDLQDLKDKVHYKDFKNLVDDLLVKIREELEIVHMVFTSNLHVVEHRDYQRAFEPIIESVRQREWTPHQLCLLHQIFQDPFHPKAQNRFTDEFKTYCRRLIDEIKNTGVNCTFYVFEPTIDEESPRNTLIPSRPYDTRTVCDLKTFTFYVLQKWLTLFQSYANLHHISISRPDSILTLTNQILDPKAGFCRRCYDYYKLYSTRSDLTRIRTLPLEVKYVLFKYRNKVPFYRLKFADQCDTPLNPRHYNEYKLTKQSANEIQSYIVYHLGQEITRLRQIS